MRLVLFGFILFTLLGCDPGLRNQLVDLTASGNEPATEDQPVEPVIQSSENTPVCGPVEAEKAMLDSVNAVRAESRTCGNAFFNAAKPLLWNCKLRDAAARHSLDMAATNFFSHTGSDGLQVSHRVTETGYNWRSVGENIAAGYSTANDVVSALLQSPGHCSNMMNPDYSEFGSHFELTDRQIYPSYWTQVFGTEFQ